MKYAVEVASGGMVYIPRFIKIILDIQKLYRTIGLISDSIHHLVCIHNV
jgi:hypothetical protein